MKKTCITPNNASADLCSCPDHSHEFTVHEAELRQMILEASGLSELFKALADETRTRILFLLSRGELCVCDLADLLETSLPAVSHHLRFLRLMHLVNHRKEGRMVFYHLADNHVLQLIQVAQEHFAEGREEVQ